MFYSITIPILLFKSVELNTTINLSKLENSKNSNIHCNFGLGKVIGNSPSKVRIPSLLNNNRNNKKCCKTVKNRTCILFIPDENKQLQSCDPSCRTCGKSAKVCTSCPEGKRLPLLWVLQKVKIFCVLHNSREYFHSLSFIDWQLR